MKRKQKMPTLAELRKLAREVVGPLIDVYETRPDASARFGWWSFDVGMNPIRIHIDHPARAVGRRMLHAALLEAKDSQ